MRCIIYELKLTAGKIIHTQEAGGGTKPCKREVANNSHFSSEKQIWAFHNRADFSALFMETFSTKETGEKNKYEKIKCHLTEILLRIWQVQGRAAEITQEMEF